MSERESYFNLDDNVIYVNHAAVAPWPVRTARAVCAFAEENARQGSRRYPEWMQVENRLREQMVELINAPTIDSIALLKNTSEGLSLIAYGLDWQPGDNVVIGAGEFPSNRIVWQSLASQQVTTREVNLDVNDPEQALIDACDENTRLLSISAVQYASGLRMNLQRLGEACRQRDILFCVDAIQQIGALQFDCQAIQADFVVADGHKWMLGPEGLALFYCRPEVMPRLKLNQFGWHMVEQMGDFDSPDWQPARSARRFECGSPNMVAVHALNASLDVLLEKGMDQVEKDVLARTAHLIERFSSIESIAILSPQDAKRYAGIFVFSRREGDNAQLFTHLQQQGVQCAPRGGGIRLSPHFYTPFEKLDRIFELVRNFVTQTGS